MKKLLVYFCIAVSLFSFCACERLNQASSRQPDKQPGPEVGTWHATYKIRDLVSDDASTETVLIISAIAGNSIIEIDLEFLEDGSFSYVTNMEKLKDSLSSSASFISAMVMGTDLSLIIDRLVETMFGNSLKQYDFGEYSTEGSIITAVTEGGEKLLFRYVAGKLIKLDDDGRDALVFERR